MHRFSGGKATSLYPAHFLPPTVANHPLVEGVPDPNEFTFIAQNFGGETSQELTIQAVDTDYQVNPVFQIFLLFLWWEIRYVRS